MCEKATRISISGINIVYSYFSALILRTHIKCFHSGDCMANGDRSVRSPNIFYVSTIFLSRVISWQSFNRTSRSTNCGATFVWEFSVSGVRKTRVAHTHDVHRFAHRHHDNIYNNCVFVFIIWFFFSRFEEYRPQIERQKFQNISVLVALVRCCCSRAPPERRHGIWIHLRAFACPIEPKGS